MVLWCLVEEAGLEPAWSALSVLGNPLPAASYDPLEILHLESPFSASGTPDGF